MVFPFLVFGRRGVGESTEWNIRFHAAAQQRTLSRPSYAENAWIKSLFIHTNSALAARCAGKQIKPKEASESAV
jgi:hypothetical protein